MIEVSVIVPNYNHAPYLKQRIDSILAQTFQNFELIILDDYSTDRSKEVIESYRGHARISHIVYNDSNSGSTFKQWEKGIDLAVGKYIWIAESDDWCEPSLLQYLYDDIESDQECAVSYCQSYCVDAQDNIKWLSQYHQLAEMHEGHDFIKKNMLYGNTIFNASMALWRKDLYKKVSPAFTDFKFCGDWLFWIELASNGKVHTNGRLLNYFRKHQDDVSGKFYKSGLNFVDELKIVDNLYLKNLITPKEYKLAYNSKLKKYRKVRPNLAKSTIDTLDHLFNNPIIGKPSLIKKILLNIGI